MVKDFGYLQVSHTDKRNKYIYLDLNVSFQWLYRHSGDLRLCWCQQWMECKTKSTR